MPYKIENIHSVSQNIDVDESIKANFQGRSFFWFKQGLTRFNDIAFQAKSKLSSEIQDKKNIIQEKIKLSSVDENQLMNRLALAVDKNDVEEVDAFLTLYVKGKMKTSLNPILISKIQQALSDETSEDFYSYDKHHLARMHLAIIERLCEAGADINCRDPEGNTMLLLASRGCNENIIKALLISSEDIHATNLRGETALMQTQNPDIAKLLIKAGVNVRARDIDGNTALHLACLRGTKKMIEPLLEGGLSINEKGTENKTPLIIACKRSDKEMIYLLHRFHIEHFRDRGDPLNIVQRDIHNDSAASLMAKDPLLQECIPRFMHEVDEEGSTPLMNVFSNYPSLFEYFKLFDKGLTEWWMEQKMLAHRFGFNSHVSFLNKSKVSLESFRADLTCDVLIKSLKEFQTINQGFQAKGLVQQDWDQIMQTLEVALENYRYGDLPDFSKLGPHAFISGWKGHGVAIVVSGDILIKCDRGGTDPKTGLTIFKIGDKAKLNEVLTKAWHLKHVDEGKEYFHQTINKELQLQDMTDIYHKPQFGGNCAWAAVKLSFQAIIYLQFLNKGLTYQEAADQSELLYRTWFDFDREQAVERYLRMIKEISQSNFSPEIKKQMKKISKEILKNVLGKCVAGKESTSRGDIFVSIIDQYPEFSSITPLTQVGNSNGYNLLILAVSRGKLKETQMLLKNGATVHEKNRLFLLSAASCTPDEKKAKSLIALLMKHGFDLNELDSNGNSLLWYTAHAGSLKTLQILIDLGSDININKNLLQSLRSKGDREEIIRFLIEKGAVEK